MTSFGRVISVRGSLARVGLLAQSQMSISEVRATVGRFVSIRCASSVIVAMITEVSCENLASTGEYVAIATMCAMCTILFMGGWLPPVALPPFTWVPGIIWFTLKALFVFFMFALVKAFVPRYRYDQLMRLGWKVFLPVSLAMVAIVAGVLQLVDALK